jgi:hypothetical protein
VAHKRDVLGTIKGSHSCVQNNLKHSWSCNNESRRLGIHQNNISHWFDGEYGTVD